MTLSGEGHTVAVRSGAARTRTPSIQTAGLWVELVPASQWPARRAELGPQLLAGVRFAVPTSVPASDPAVVALPLASLDAGTTELWCTNRPIQRWQEQGISLADDGLLLLGCLQVPAAEGDDLEAQTRAAYVRLLEVCSAHGCLHLLRFWNVVPQINGEHRGIERYKLFCKGRAEGYAAHYGEAHMEAFLPASSAVGGHGDALTVQFIASREAGRHVENPRQVAAYRYPPQYGPKSPSFARGTVAPVAAGSVIFISGTASIVGHESVHEDDLAAQLDETLRNIHTLLEEIDGAPLNETSFATRVALLRVYVRRGADWPLLRDLLQERFGKHIPMIAVAAEICRRELLLEIEGVVRPR